MLFHGLRESRKKPSAEARAPPDQIPTEEVSILQKRPKRAKAAAPRKADSGTNQGVSRGLKRKRVQRPVEDFPSIRIPRKTTPIRHLLALEQRMLHGAWRNEQKIFRDIAHEKKLSEANAEDISTRLARTRGKRQRLEKNLQAEIIRNDREYNQIEGDIKELELDIKSRPNGFKVVNAAHAAVAVMIGEEAGKKTTGLCYQTAMTMPHQNVPEAPSRAVSNARPRERVESDGDDANSAKGGKSRGGSHGKVIATREPASSAASTTGGVPQVHKYGTRSRARVT